MRIDERLGSWVIVAALTAGLTALTTTQALQRYDDLRTGWSWDLAYYNQWYWALTQGDGVISVRPISSYATEGPQVWKSNYLSPARYMIAPIYMAFPGPRTLLVICNVVFWWVIPAAYTLSRSESGSSRVALGAATLVPLTPLAWPIVWNDFRELTMAMPFVLWAFQGVRARRVGLTAAGVAGMLACRQEFAIVVAWLAFLPPREDEDVGRKALWRLVLFDVGLGWLVLAFFGYLYFFVGRYSPQAYFNQFMGQKPTLAQTWETLSEFLRDGFGAWSILMLAVPGAALLAGFWVWNLAAGQWAMRFLTGSSWHHVRYATPSVATTIAAGVVGYSQMAAWLRGVRGGAAAMVVLWLASAIFSAAGTWSTVSRMSSIPRSVAAADVEPYWAWVRQVAPDDAVLASYEFTAPLSSRKSLYSHVMSVNEPKGYPNLRPEFRWVFWKTPEYGGVDRFVSQGFVVVHRGPSLTILRRS